MLQQIKDEWKKIISDELLLIAKEKGVQEHLVMDVGEIAVQTPPKPEMGDLAFPLFPFAKVFRSSPVQLVQLLNDRLGKKEGIAKEQLLPAGPYLNVKIDVASLAHALEKEIEEKKEKYGHTTLLTGKKVMVEFSCPNTNKPLHLGHLRNDAIGMSLARLLDATGAQ
ncbi:MAG: arginine--tRNA ligase, partial [Spirochaetia bacterium]|nr:arginine--tRNA ligase [Spirochaetia bacterium]